MPLNPTVTDKPKSTPRAAPMHLIKMRGYWINHRFDWIENCFDRSATRWRWHLSERPLLAVSGPSFQWFSRYLNVRFREKRTFNMKQNRLVPRRSGHQMGTWSGGGTRVLCSCSLQPDSLSRAPHCLESNEPRRNNCKATQLPPSYLKEIFTFAR